MVGLKRWQWVVLGLPVALTAALVLLAAGWQLQRWGLSWLWATLVPVFWGRTLLAYWHRNLSAEQLQQRFERKLAQA